MNSRTKVLVILLFLFLSAVLFAGCDQTATLPHEQHFFQEISCTATCTEDGIMHYACSCGAAKQEPVKAGGHDLHETARRDATCTRTGTIVYICSECEMRTVETLPLQSHILSQTQTDPTCDRVGSITTICANCEYKTVEILGVCEHIFDRARTEPTCQTEGAIVTTCANCPYRAIDVLPIIDHSPTEADRLAASCVHPETVVYRCSMCGDETRKTIGEALGHQFDESFCAPLTDLQPCTRTGCTYATLQQDALDNMAAFAERLAFDGLDESFIERVNENLYRLQFILEDVGPYDPACHAYDKNSELVATELKLSEYWEDLWDCYEEAVVLYQFAQIQNDMVISDAERLELYVYMAGYQQSIYSQIASFYQKAYDSGLREYVFHGWSEERIAEVLASHRGYSDPTYVALSTRKAELEAEIAYLSSTQVNGLPEIYTNDRILDIYAEYVENNNRMAEILGGTNSDGSLVYPNGLYYSYKEIFGREYTPDDAEMIYQSIVTYIVPLYRQYSAKIAELSANAKSNWTEEQFAEYERLSGSFLSDMDANASLNAFLKEISITFGNQTATYYDAWLEMLQTGSLVIGERNAAYTGYFSGVQSPLIFLGNYDRLLDNMTFVHEFGHYMNFRYRAQIGGSNTPYDLAETHSQGLEMLYLTYVSMQCKPGMEEVYEFYYIADIYTRLSNILSQISVDRFERAVYSGFYDGAGAEIIMADGRITKDEYDLLYRYIQTEELGLPDNTYPYWRVNADRFGYCISYSVSLLASLQMLSEPEDFAERVDCYTKLITYLEEPNASTYTYRDALNYAGLYSYDDDALFAYLYDLLSLPPATEAEIAA